MTGPDIPCILGIHFLWKGYFKYPKGYKWAFEVATVETDDIDQQSTLPRLSDDPFFVGLLKVEDQKVPTASITVQHWQYRTNQDSLHPTQNLI